MYAILRGREATLEAQDKRQVKKKTRWGEGMAGIKLKVWSFWRNLGNNGKTPDQTPNEFTIHKPRITFQRFPRTELTPKLGTELVWFRGLVWFWFGLVTPRHVSKSAVPWALFLARRLCGPPFTA